MARVMFRSMMMKQSKRDQMDLSQDVRVEKVKMTMPLLDQSTLDWRFAAFQDNCANAMIIKGSTSLDSHSVGAGEFRLSQGKKSFTVSLW